MFNIDKLNINFSFSSIYFYAGLLIIAAYTVYTYKFTVPQVNRPFKFLLISLRTLALLLILFTIFEPVLSIARKSTVKPVNLFYVDNSKSITIQDGTGREESIKNFLNRLEASGVRNNSEVYSFGSNIRKVARDSLSKINFSEGTTNISRIFSSIKTENKNIASIVLISDGVITDGSNPVFQAEKLGIPVYTVGVGDTSGRDNIEVRKVLFNDYIYNETPTTINVTLASNGFKNKTVTLSLYEDNKQIGQQNVLLGDNEMMSANFTYTAKTPGEKKMMVSVSEQKGEFTFADNKKVFYMNVLNNKLNTLIVAGSPSPDLSFVKNSLATDENLRISTITQAGPNRFLENVNQNRLLDSANVIYLVGFPSAQTPQGLLNRVLQEIRDKGKPYCIILSSGTDFNKLRDMQSELPFTVGRVFPGYTEVQPSVTPDELQNPLLQNNSPNIVDAWNNLPPVLRSNVEISAKPESNILARVRINNIPVNSPLILTRKLGNKKSVAILAKDIWRWKLETSEKRLDVFDRIMQSGVKWLNTREEQKLVMIKTSRKIYSLGEPVEFTAQVYDETFNPVDAAEVTVNVKSGKDEYSVNMNSLSGGIYEGTLVTSNPGDYVFSGSAKLNDKVLGKDAGRFSIGDVEIEMINPVMDKGLLNLLALQTGGKFFYGKNIDQLFNILQENNRYRTKEKITHSEIVLWSNEWMLVGIILLLAAEWFLRKRSGML